jgi:predicted Zn-dependent protease with MMP-like domain
MPDRITIFQRNIERICRTHEQVVNEVRETVLHEIAHHLGISDARLRELGY